MTLTVESRRLPYEEKGSADLYGQRTYEYSWMIDQTDSGSRAAPAAMVIAAQQGGSPDPVPQYGDNPNFDGFTDLDSYAQGFSWYRPDPVNYPKRVICDVQFAPARSIKASRLAEPDPLLWETEYWVEWTEEQVVIFDARNVDPLPAINRDALTLGKVVNACGVEWEQTLTKTVYYPVLHCQKQYETLEEIVALNLAYQETTNNATFFGSPPRTAKYLGTESGRIQKVGGSEFYVGITRIWFKNETWDRKILNNGYSHFELNEQGFIYDGQGHKKLFRNDIFDIPGQPADGLPNVAATDPLNLTMIGTILPNEYPPFWISYRYLEEVNYAGIGIGG